MIEDDEIMQELRAVREAYARKFNYDIKRMFDDLRKRQAARLRKEQKQTRSKPSKAGAKPRKRRRAA